MQYSAARLPNESEWENRLYEWVGTSHTSLPESTQRIKLIDQNISTIANLLQKSAVAKRSFTRVLNIHAKIDETNKKDCLSLFQKIKGHNETLGIDLEKNFELSLLTGHEFDLKLTELRYFCYEIQGHTGPTDHLFKMMQNIDPIIETYACLGNDKQIREAFGEFIDFMDKRFLTWSPEMTSEQHIRMATFTRKLLENNLLNDNERLNRVLFGFLSHGCTDHLLWKHFFKSSFIASFLKEAKPLFYQEMGRYLNRVFKMEGENTKAKEALESMYHLFYQIMKSNLDEIAKLMCTNEIIFKNVELFLVTTAVRILENRPVPEITCNLYRQIGRYLLDYVPGFAHGMIAMTCPKLNEEPVSGEKCITM